MYADDIIVFSSTVEEHLDHLTQVFGRLRKIGLSCIHRSVVSLDQKFRIWTISSHLPGFPLTLRR